MPTTIEKLEAAIAARDIRFDRGQAVELKAQLLGTGPISATAKLQELVLVLADAVPEHIRISSIVRTSGHHGDRRAVDIANQEIARKLLPIIATDAKVAALEVDELIFDARVVGEADGNKWNYDRGASHTYDNATLGRHKDHIHFSVKA